MVKGCRAERIAFGGYAQSLGFGIPFWHGRNGLVGTKRPVLLGRDASGFGLRLDLKGKKVQELRGANPKLETLN